MSENYISLGEWTWVVEPAKPGWEDSVGRLMRSQIDKPERSDVRQHVSDAAWERLRMETANYQATNPHDLDMELVTEEEELAERGLMLVTVEEWDASISSYVKQFEAHRSALSLVAELQAANKVLSEQVEELREKLFISESTLDSRDRNIEWQVAEIQRLKGLSERQQPNPPSPPQAPALIPLYRPVGHVLMKTPYEDAWGRLGGSLWWESNE